MNLQELTITSCSAALQKKEFSAHELAREYFKNINDRDKTLHAYIRLHEEQALRDAEATDRARAKNENPPLLAGIPLAIKDNILIKDFPATAASKSLEHYIAPYDATVIQKLKQAHAVFLGKTNLDEFAMGSSTENSAFQTTSNPYDAKRVSGGSSGGSAAAVAANLALGALGSDTGGSIRQPAGFCGVVGLKPTYGAVSRFGVIALASSLDQIGPIAKTVEDAEMLFNAIKGPDPLDATAHEERARSKKIEIPDIKNLVIGLPKEYFEGGLEKEVERAMDEVIKSYTSHGATFKEISLPHTRYAIACYYIILTAEASANLARYDGIRYAGARSKTTPRYNSGYPEQGRMDTSKSRKSALHNIYFNHRGKGFGSEVKRRIILGTFVLSSGYYDAYYKKAQQVRALISHDFEEAFKKVNVILSPISPTLPFKIGEKTHDPLAMYLSDIFTISVNLAGLPALAIPTLNPKRYTPNAKTLPVGFQLIGPHFSESLLFETGKQYEKTRTA